MRAPTRCRTAAEERRNVQLPAAASSSSTVALMKVSTVSRSCQRPSFRASAISWLKACQLRVGKASGREIEQGGDGLFRRSVEKRVGRSWRSADWRARSRGARWGERRSGETSSSCQQMPALLGTRSGARTRNNSAGRLRRSGRHFGSSHAPTPGRSVDDIRDLAFAATAELRLGFLTGIPALPMYAARLLL